MESFIFYFKYLYPFVSIGLLIFLVRLNTLTTIKEEKINLQDCLMYLLLSCLGGWLMFYYVKYYIITGMLFATVVALLASLPSLDKEEAKDSHVFHTLTLCLLCVFFWVQIFCINYLVIKRRGLEL